MFVIYLQILVWIHLTTIAWKLLLSIFLGSKSPGSSNYKEINERYSCLFWVNNGKEKYIFANIDLVHVFAILIVRAWSGNVSVSQSPRV